MQYRDDDVFIATSTVQDGNLDFRFGEEAEVIQNRRTFLDKHDLTLEDCVVMEVEHKDHISIVGRAAISRDPRATIQTEALVTKEPGVALFLLTADCQPITLHDPGEQVIALAHLGWKSTELKLIQTLIEKMFTEYGSRPENIRAWIGPGIKKESYVFDQPEQAANEDWRPFLEKLPSGETSVDVLGYNATQMMEAGVSENNITIDPTDTATSDEYFSHYRSVRTSEPQGRFATVAMLR